MFNYKIQCDIKYGEYITGYQSYFQLTFNLYFMTIILCFGLFGRRRLK